MSFWYRTDIFKKHDLAEPKSFAELEAICATLIKSNIHCASFGGKFGWHPMRLLDVMLEVKCGPALRDRLNKLEARWDEPCVIESYTTLKKWVDNKWLVPDFLNVTPADARMPVYLGKAAMIIEGDWFEPVVRGDGQSSENLDFFILPTGHEPVRFSAFPQQWMIPVGSKKPDAAAQFIDWITRPDVQKQHPTAFVATAVVGVQPDCKVWPRSCEWRELITGDSKTYPPTDQAFTKELMDSFFEVQDGIIAGRLAPADGAKLMQQRAEAWKAKKGG
jgi:raffinose/stachyose/melibiose transport system substrate-binding protein